MAIGIPESVTLPNVKQLKLAKLLKQNKNLQYFPWIIRYPKEIKKSGMKINLYKKIYTKSIEKQKNKKKFTKNKKERKCVNLQKNVKI